MASSRLLISPSAGAKIVSLRKPSLQISPHRAEARHYLHQSATADLSESQHDHLQSTIEGVMSVVGGKMVVSDMRFTRDSFEYWRNAAIPSSSLVKGLSSTWATTSGNGAIPGVPLTFPVEQTMGKRMEAFLQRMVADVEQRIETSGVNPLQNRRLDVKLAEEQESLIEEEKFKPKPVFKQTLRDIESVVLPELQTPETKHGSTSADVQGFAIMKEGKREDEQGTGGVQDLMAAEETSDKLIRQLILQSACEQAAAAKQDKSEASKLELGRGLDAQSTDGQYLIIKEQKTNSKQGLNSLLSVEEVTPKDLEKSEATEELNKRLAEASWMNEQEGAELRNREVEPQHIKESSSERREPLLVADAVQKAMEKEKVSEATEAIRGGGVEKRRAVLAGRQNYAKMKDYHQQQTDNIVKKTERMGKKIVHVYYDKSARGRAPPLSR